MTTIRENLLALQALIERTPDTGMNLDSYAAKCGSIHCTLGWAAWCGQFEGLTSDGYGNPLIHGEGFIGENLDQIFGDNCWLNVFDTYGDGDLDKDILDAGRPSRSPSHKQLALARISKQLEIYP